MQVSRDTVVAIHYDMRDEAGTVLESSREGPPVVLLHGRGNVVRGLEDALLGREAGEKFEVQVPPDYGYGRRSENWVQRFSKKDIAGPKRLKVGDTVSARTPNGVKIVSVRKIGGKTVDVDMNHPLAGRTVSYAVEVMELRPASQEELSHGHAHGIGGHQH